MSIKKRIILLFHTAIYNNFDPSGNGTINKQAGIDHKQLSLLAKINENQSGEVSSPCVNCCVSPYVFSIQLLG